MKDKTYSDGLPGYSRALWLGEASNDPDLLGRDQAYDQGTS